MKEYLGKEVNVIIDRVIGSKHPKWNFYYPINYGYIPSTISGDGEEIDVYIIGEFEPVKDYIGIAVAVIYRKDDNEQKLVVCKDRHKFTKEQIRALVEFQERFFDSYIVM